MSTTCLVSFTARRPDGAVMPNARAVFVPVGDPVAAVGGWTVPRARVEVTANASGLASVNLVGGSWTVTFISDLGQMTAPFDCPASGTANLETLLGQTLLPAFNAIQLAVLAAGGRGLFETPAAGRAATTNGQIFLAPLVPSGVGIYRRDSAASSPQIGSYFTGEVTVGAIDTTPNRLLKVGDFGLGASAPTNVADFNTNQPAGAYTFGGTTLNKPLDPTFAGCAVRLSRINGVGAWLAINVSGATGLGAPRAHLKASSLTPDDWTGWAEIFTQASVLGPVSQLAGVPTGALIERGANGNGQFSRWADGTLICWHKLSITGAINTAFLGGFRSAGQTWTFPSAFSVAPVVTGSPGNLNSFQVTTNAATGAGVSVLHTAIASQASAALIADLVAVGRWF